MESSPAPRRIAHLDMDAFFASVELLHYPALRGQPVVVGGSGIPSPGGRFGRLRDYVGRGVVTTSTYEARALGVFSGMGLMKSARLAPEAILLPAQFEAYRAYSRRFKAAVAAIAPCIEDRGIDEIYIDLTEQPGETHALAQQLKAAVLAATGLTCSIGVAPNKLLAKLCSDLQKPDGVTLLAADEIPARIWPLPVAKINGIGPKASARLQGLAINTVGELAAAPLALLVEQFGRATGQWLHEAAHGLDDRPVQTAREPKSVSRETTFSRDMDARQDRSQLSEIFTGICQRVAGDLQRQGYVAHTIGIKLKYSDFQVASRDHTLTMPTADGQQIRRWAGECLKRIPLNRRIRLLGVRASGLAPLSALQGNPVQGRLALEG